MLERERRDLADIVRWLGREEETDWVKIFARKHSSRSSKDGLDRSNAIRSERNRDRLPARHHDR